jgi:hypothetical protein
MFTLDSSMGRLVMEGKIEYKAALESVPDTKEFAVKYGQYARS